MRLGDEVEIRVAQVWFWEGSFARRGISLQRHFREALQVTDLDLVAIEFDSRLQPKRVIGESKSGSGKAAPRPLDRVIWLRGLMALLGDASAAELTTAMRASPQVRELARGLSVSVQSLDDLARREDRLKYNGSNDRGSQGITAFGAAERAHRAVHVDPDLERFYWLVRGDVWRMTPWMAIKRLLAAISAVNALFAPKVNDERQFAIRWLLAEMIGSFALHLVVIGGHALPLDTNEFTALVSDQLADPGVDPRRMRQISESVDKYVAGVLRQAKAKDTEIASSMGAFMPTAPDYSEALAETARRLSLRPDVARVLPRYVDLVIHERLVRGRDVDEELIHRLGSSDDPALVRGARLIAAFLAGQAGLHPLVVEMLSRNPESTVQHDAASGPGVAAAARESTPVPDVTDPTATTPATDAGPEEHGAVDPTVQMTWTEPTER